MKSEDIQLSVLSKLNVMNNYGYELIKHEDFKDIDKSQFYKILRKMKAEGLIEIVDTEKETGKPREILGITEIGRKEYIDKTYESARSFMTLIREIIIDALGEMVITQFKRWEMDYIFESAETILLELDYPLEHQLALLNHVGDQFKNASKFYLRVKAEEKEMMTGTARFGNVEYLDETTTIFPSSVDLVVTMCGIDKNKLCGPAGFIKYLKPGGTLISISWVKDSPVVATSGLNQIRIFNLLQRVFDEDRANELTEKFAALTMPNSLFDPSLNEISREEWEKILERHFQESDIKTNIAGMPDPPVIVYHGKGKKDVEVS
ncbi:MAG: PadR family transcriptional regulator [Candidatus Hodarchaeota archaeon]